MQHFFDVEIAKQYGIEEAIILNNLYYWIEKNKANNKHYYNDNWWTYNSKKAFSLLFPYMTERKIDYVLNNLIKNELIVSGNFNSNKLDRTLWYAITKKGYCILQNCKMENTKLLNDIYNNIYNKDITNINSSNINNNNIAVLQYLNEKAGTKFRPVESNLKFINARLQNYTFEDLIKVIDLKVNEWKGTKMEKYIRPETLFNATKFESYVNEKQEEIKPNSEKPKSSMTERLQEAINNVMNGGK